MVDAAQPAVRGDQLDREDAVGREAELPGIPADAAAERVAGDADVRRRAVERGEAELGRPRHDLLPLGARPHPRDAPLGVDHDAAEAVGAQQDHVVHRPERLGVVARALRRDLQPVGGRVADDLGDVPLVLGHGHGSRLLGEGGVVGQGGSVPAGLAGLEHRAADASAEPVEGAGLDCGHAGSSSGGSCDCKEPQDGVRAGSPQSGWLSRGGTARRTSRRATYAEPCPSARFA